jgi:NAD(P)-dependent dehydrogenase (short-subunit alcohol dehydrogenase family)
MRGTERFSLEGKTALILGGSSGIGRAIALGYQAAGASIVAVGRTKVKVDAVAAELRQVDPGAQAFACDLTDPRQMSQMIAAVLAVAGRIDVLVNSQGVTLLKRAEDFTRADYDQVIATNLTSVFFACSEVGRHMLGFGSGAIINIASVAAFRGFQASALYTMSKHGVLALTETLAAEWATRGVRVNGIAPGFFMTPLNRDKMSAERKLMALRRTPMHRFGELDELVGAAIFLASQAASYVTGETLRVDGGFLAAGLD